MADPTFTAAPAVIPSRAAPSTFSALTDAFLVWEKTFRNELSSSVSWFALASSQTAASADAAAASASESLASALSASAVSGAVAWVSAAPYTAFSSVVISAINAQTYRAKTTHSGVATDPSADATNWARLTFGGAYADLSGKPTLGTAAALNTGTVSGTIPILGAGGALPAVSGANLTDIPMGFGPTVKVDVPTSGTQFDVTLPAGMGMVKMEGIIRSTSIASFTARTSTDGVTFPATGSDYSTNGSNNSQIALNVGARIAIHFSFDVIGLRNSASHFSLGGLITTANTSEFLSAFRKTAEAVTTIRFFISAGVLNGGTLYLTQMNRPA